MDATGRKVIVPMKGNSSQQFPVRWAVLVVLCLTWTALTERISDVCRADEPASATEAQPTDIKASPRVTTESAAPADHATAPDQVVEATDESPEQAAAERERKAQLREQLRRRFATLLVIVLLAVLISVMFLLWGIRRRRLLRKPLPVIHKGDELWFLKPATQKADENPPDTPPTNPNAE